MIDSGQAILPVIDDERKLIGDLRISEFLHAVLEAEDQGVEGKSSGPVRT